MGTSISRCGPCRHPSERAAGASCLAGVWLRASRTISSTGTPLPRVQHRRVQREDVCRGTAGRLMIVGDVHGCATELRALLDKACFQADKDTLVLVGDLVNKGPLSGEVIRLCREANALVVRGNHDDELLEAWYRVGRFSPARGGLRNYHHDALYQATAADIRWIRDLPLSLSFPWLDLVVAHAGLVPNVSLEKQRFRDLLFIRNVHRVSGDGTQSAGGCCWEGFEGIVKGKESVPWAEAWLGPTHVVFGHDARRKLQMQPYATGLDTGCCYGGHLTALVIDPDDFSDRTLTQVRADRVYSPPKDG
eukprot:TRINITY_DN20729_c0_g1_i1.p1 TRINITY_DN20729_c0_g1~~TRINITY_DN20729_c0_g1_i1.p1  ORF type:complete len:306 (+),score=27.67 TRINITY_DN20729_c0_g1_i1:64-981(+)